MQLIKSTTFELISITKVSSMAYHVNQDIKANYSFYEKLLHHRKSIFESVIDIQESSDNANFLEQNIAVNHFEVDNKIDLIVVVKINNHRYFQFKLRCTDLCATPFFRYDSDGSTHRNYDADIPLKDQQVPTPHFHKFNEHGVNLAYKSEKLLNEAEVKALQDINLCIAYFCQESNITPHKEDFPSIQINATELPLDFSLIDPLLNVKF